MIRTERLLLRQMNVEDFDALSCADAITREEWKRICRGVEAPIRHDDGRHP